MFYIQRYRRIITRTLLFLVVLSLTISVQSISALPNVGQQIVSTTALAQVTFRDIGRHRYQEQIQQAANLRFIGGFPDGTFRPDDTLTREQAVSIILAAIGKTESDWRGLPNRFTDVPSGHWSTEKIAYAASQGIVAGREPGIFDPFSTVTRAELMAMLRRVADSYFAGRTQGAGVNFSDTAGHWANETISFMSRYCSVATPLNESGNRFAPNSGATRGYTAAAIVRLHNCGQTLTPPGTPPSPPNVMARTLPGYAEITAFSGQGNIKRDADAQSAPVAVNSRIYDGGSVSLTSGTASFGLVGGDNYYSGLLYQTKGVGSYQFLCTIEGDFLIGWSANSGVCRREGSENYITITRRRNTATTSYLPKPFTQVARIFGVGEKQQGGSFQDLLVDSADGIPVLIETVLDREFGTYTVKVLQGNIEIKSDASSPGIFVNEGQQYIYSGGDVSDGQIIGISTTGLPLACQELDALNSAELISPETPNELGRAIAEQIKEHQQASGLMGQPANLASYEQTIVDEINRARTNPQQYALELQQFFESGGPSSSLYTPAYTDYVSPEDVYTTLPGGDGPGGDRWDYLSASRKSYNYVAAVNLLRDTGSLPPLSTSAGLSTAAMDFVEGGSASGEVGWPSESLLRYGSHPCDQIQPTVYYGELLEPKMAVMQLFAIWTEYTSGPSLDFAPFLLSPKFSIIGVDCASHPRLQGVCTLIFSDSFIESGQ